MACNMKLCNWMIVIAALLLLGCFNGVMMMVDGLSCPVCMYREDSPGPCPMMPCTSEQDYHKSAAAILMDYGRIKVTELNDESARPGLIQRQSDVGSEGTSSAQDPASTTGGSHLCFKVLGPAQVNANTLRMFLPVVIDNTNVVASGCTGSSTKYQPKEGAYTLKQDEWVELTKEFRFGGELHICNEKTGSGPDCGEKSNVGDGSTSHHEQTDTQIPPDLSILHCNACLYKKGSPKPCKSVPCTSDEEYYMSAGIVYTDFLKLIGNTFENLSPKTRRSVHENIQKMRPSSKTRSTNGISRRSRNVESEPFYCYSFTGKITDTLDFSRHLNDEEVVASGCSTPMEDEGNKRYLPSLHPHKGKSIKTTSFLTFEGEGYTCNKTVEIGPNCRPALKDDGTSSPIVHGKPPTKPKPGRNPIGQGQGPGSGASGSSEDTEEEPGGDNPEAHKPGTSASEAGAGNRPVKDKGKGGHGGGDSAAMTIGPASISTLCLSLISFLRLIQCY